MGGNIGERDQRGLGCGEKIERERDVRGREHEMGIRTEREQ